MKAKRALAALLCVITILAAGCAKQQTQSASGDVVPFAEKFVASLASGNYAAAEQQFDAQMKSALPEKELAKIWASLKTQYGPYKRVSGARVEKQAGFDVVILTCEFQKGKTGIKVVFDGSKQIGGLWNVPV